MGQSGGGGGFYHGLADEFRISNIARSPAWIQTEFSSQSSPAAFFSLGVQQSVGGGGTVATPTFNPPAGTYNSAQPVTISTTTAGASIYYTTNGARPQHFEHALYRSGQRHQQPHHQRHRTAERHDR